MNRVIHFEIPAPDPAATIAFHERTLGWTVQKWGGGEQDYWLVTTGADGAPGINGGIMQSRDGQPRTINTVQVESVDEMAHRVTEAGGQIVLPKFAVPGVGWVADAADPDGNIFGFMEEDADAR